MSNVSVGKPAIAGGVYIAPVGTTLPTDTTSALTGFTSLGYVSEDGLTNGSGLGDNNEVKAWGGDTVLTLASSDTEDTFSFTLIESLNVNVLKAVYGDANVTGTLANGIAVNVANGLRTSHAWVFDMIMSDDHVKRICVPSAVITERGDVVYKDDEAIGYNVTINCVADASGNTHYEYIK